MSLPKICTCPTVPAADCPFHHKDACGSLAAMPCSPSFVHTYGKSFTLVGYGCSALVKRTKEEGLVLWSVCNYGEDGDEFTRGWSGCDPKQLYFLEKTKLISRRSDPV